LSQACWKSDFEFYLKTQTKKVALPKKQWVCVKFTTFILFTGKICMLRKFMKRNP